MALEGEHLVIINELPLEKYLCYVVPSEMPVKYGVEALKCMAVCARSYAYQHILGNNYRMYGAHVDDSVSFQVYNNIKPQENSTQAVKETHGQILQDMAGNVVTAYYYSTSCGYGSDLSVWGNTASDIYCSGAINPAHEKYDLSSETAFRSFLDNERQEDFDYEFPYYRWSVYVPCEDASSRFNEYLQRRVATHSGEIYLADENGNDIGGNIEEISDIGAIFDMQILERTGCGLVKKILVRGTNANIVISGELNIRYLLGPGENELHTHLDTTTTFYILPSAYMYFELDKTDGELKGIRYYGGGYGHGIGMSQNAVYAMVKCGMRYDEILSYFYQNTKLGQIS